ncbi:bifunctional protein-disulfide isomerase/oxidoreductase DsbC [Ferrimonas senticii]|uniref:bifunctional protein-disulfide isomerase/oxidoreductase DsbC n=1 Tax=Ferrimonas senticii TaxID=394566 RepID=UPI000483E72C|nr:bifunctional protein-disulfide isomerase/oxidoreductase DsbC [Ferrimonas senticii]
MKKSVASVLVSALMAFSVSAATVTDSAAIAAKVKSTLGVQVDKVVPSPVAGMLQLHTDKGIFYISEDGKTLFHGNLYDLDNRMANLTDAALTEVRRDQLAKLDGTTIDFPADNEKYVISVFTDISCGYCRKLHDDIAEYNKLGITVRYLAFPRNGQNAGTWDEMEAIWCAADQQQAMTDGKTTSQRLSKTDCAAAKHVATHYQVGGGLGVTGTPAIVTQNGDLIPGYMPPQQLLEALKRS